MNSHPGGEQVTRDGTTLPAFVPADRPETGGRDAEIEAARRMVESEHSRLIEALANAETALAMRDEVLAIVAHDLRSPLNAVLTSAGFLLDVDHSDDERRRLLAVIRRAASGMNRLIDDLLDVARMESGAFTIELRTIDPGALVHEVCEQFRRQAADAKVTLECEIQRDLPRVRADSDRISQVLENLIGNALKFTPAGGRVAVTVARSDGDGLRCCVADTGAGISPDDLAHLFERFWQARRYRRGGAGLGLAIARGIVEAHGSDLEVESEVGAGSTFAFHLR